MLYKDGDEIWLPPIRYFDTPIPPVRKCRVIGDQYAEGHFNMDQKSLYVYSNVYGHAVYVGFPVFYIKESAEKYCEHMAAIHKIICRDEAHQITNRIFEAEGIPLGESQC